MADSSRIVVTAAEMDQMSPQQRADAVAAAAAHSWEGVAEPFRSDVLATARTLGEQRRKPD
ncbi:MAG TPA: hypothetical protein VES40_13480 [Ilumatobacteraceae bacterium]|nr:hypothetical protein [Ilumatobacteraceae bacterium]